MPMFRSRSSRIPRSALAARVLPCVLVLVAAAAGAAAAPATNEQRSKPQPQAQTLRAARAGHATKLVPNSFKPDGPAPEPTVKQYVRVRYPSPAGNLVAYLTPDPKDGKRRPAVVWAHGGFGGIDESYWAKQPASNDQTPKAFLDAGFVVMLPSWRGENDNPGRFELFYGEVDDAVAAVDYVSKLPYVDPGRIYFAGHSTGGTIALLTALATDKVRAAFSFGGAPDVGRVVSNGEGYGNTPYDPRDQRESRLRSAIHYVGSLKTPTWYFEGATSFYVDDAREMARRAKAAGAPFEAFIVEGGNHFDILRPLTQLLAAKLSQDTGRERSLKITGPEVTAAFERARDEARRRRAGKPLVTLTPAAAKQVLATIKQQGLDPKKVHLKVTGRGLDLTEDVDPAKDEVTESRGVRIAVPRDVAADVRGTTVDFPGQGFKLIGPTDD